MVLNSPDITKLRKEVAVIDVDMMTNAGWLYLTGICFKPIQIVVRGGRVVKIVREVVAPSGYEYSFSIQRPDNNPDADDAPDHQLLGRVPSPSRERDLQLFAIRPPCFTL